MSDPEIEADQANASRARAAALERLQRDRQARRAAEPLPAGSLFDEVTRDQIDLLSVL